LIAIANAIIWYRFTQQHRLTPDNLISDAEWLAGGALLALILYSLLVGVLIYDKVIVVAPNKTDDIKIIGGFWLTLNSRRALREGNPRPLSVGDLLKGAAYNPDYVWPKFSRALSKACFQLTYIALVGCGTCALSTISMLVASAT